MLLAVVVLGAIAAALPAFQPEQEETSATHAQRTAELGLMLLDEDNGLFVLAITEYSPAWRAGFQAGDLLLSSGDTPLTSVLQLESLISTAGGSILSGILVYSLQKAGVLKTMQDKINAQ